MLDVADPVVVYREIASRLGASVGGAVVNEDQFPVCECLVADALHGFCKVALLIEEDQHDRDKRHGSSLADLTLRQTKACCTCLLHRRAKLRQCGFAPRS